MRSRIEMAALLLTLPLWFIPFLIVAGWRSEGRDVIADIPVVWRHLWLPRI